MSMSRIYRCITAHSSQQGLTPDVTPLLWIEIPLSDILDGIRAAFDEAMNKTMLFPPSLFSLLTA